VIIILIVLTFI